MTKIKHTIYVNEEEDKYLKKLKDEYGQKTMNNLFHELIFSESNPLATRLNNVESEILELNNNIKIFQENIENTTSINSKMFIILLSYYMGKKPTKEGYILAVEQYKKLITKNSKTKS
jgi:hypothetical protein